MRISVLNRQTCACVPAQFIKNLASFLSGIIRPRRQLPSHIVVILTDNRGIAAISYCKEEEKPTDVLCYPYCPVPGEKETDATADIFINVERAVMVAAKMKKTFQHEVALYVAHALDHLAGGSDATLRGRQNMRKRELLWLKKAHAAGLLRS